MHDPLTLIATIPNPFIRKKSPGGRTYRPPLIDIWHRDPERDGTDDSCDWFNRKRPMNAAEKSLAEAIWAAESIFGNAPFYKATSSDLRRAHDAWRSIYEAQWDWRQRWGRRLFHPRWHIHHWHIRVWPYMHLLRWLFNRCRICGGRFRWGESGVSRGWGGDGPRWFRDEGLAHTRHSPVVTSMATLQDSLSDTEG